MMMAVLIVIYAATPLVAGHGIVPIGAALFVDQPSWWPSIVGWSGAAAIGLSFHARLRSTLRLFARLSATCALYFSWFSHVVVFASGNAPAEQGAVIESMLLLSLPLQLVTLVVLCKLMGQLKRSLDPKRS